MTNIRQLKQTVNRIADTANRISDTIRRFEDENDRNLNEILRVLDGTDSGVDSDVMCTLDAASSAMQDASRAMQDVAWDASDYSRRL